MIREYCKFIFGSRMGQCCSKATAKYRSDRRKMEFPKLHDHPVIGIMAVLADQDPFGRYVIPASYVKSVEASGARIVPIIPGQQEEYYRHLFEKLNGLLIPGGAGSPTGFQRPVVEAVSFFYQWAIDAYENSIYWPIWGTCLGFETLLDITEGKSGKLLSHCNMPRKSFPMKLTTESKESRMIQSVPKDLIEEIPESPVFPHLHAYCVTVEDFKKRHLDDFYMLIGTNRDKDGLFYVSAIEARNGYPIYGVMGHPEKVMYSWTKVFEFDRSLTSIRVAQHWMNFFVQECCKNNHHFDSTQEEQAALIFNYPPVFVTKVVQKATSDMSYYFN